jgi:hypothetical protein
MTHDRRRWVAACLVLGVTAAAPASAQLTEKAAIKQCKAAIKTRVDLFKGTLAGARLTVVARADAFDVAVATDGFTILGAQGLVDDLADFQTNVEEALFDVAVDAAADCTAALAALAGGGTLEAIPIAFANLPGGLPEQGRAAIAKALANTYKAVNKRLAKSSAAVGKTGDGTLFATLGPPPQLFFAFSEERSDAILFDLAIDLRVSASTTDPDATRLWVGGTTAIDSQSLTVSAVPMILGSVGDDEQVTSEGRGRFLAPLGEDVVLPRNNYLLGVAPGFGASASSAFAIR